MIESNEFMLGMQGALLALMKARGKTPVLSKAPVFMRAVVHSLRDVGLAKIVDDRAMLTQEGDAVATKLDEANKIAMRQVKAIPADVAKESKRQILNAARSALAAEDAVSWPPFPDEATRHEELERVMREQREFIASLGRPKV